MASTASVAQFTSFQVASAGSPSAFVTVGNFKSWTGPTGEAAEIDVTNLASTGKEFLMGLRDEGNYTLELDYDPLDAGQLRLMALRAASALGEFKLNGPDATVEHFWGVVKSFSRSGGVDQVRSASVSIRVSGAVI